MYTQENYNELLQQLKELADPKYQKFHSGLLPDVDNVLGVSVPKLRKLAKELINSCENIDDYLTLAGTEYYIDDYLTLAGTEYYEETMLEGIVIGYVKCSWNKKLKYIKDFVPKINNWAVCDAFCGGIRPPKNQLENFRDFIEPYLHSENEFYVRFGVVMLMQKFITDDYIDSTLHSLEQITRSEYYTQMAVAWALSVCYVKFPQQTLTLFKQYSLQPAVQNKAIQKCRESLRVSKADKAILLNYKIK